ncbi:MAG: class I SAM-dependent methyltransferase [Fibromonadales bacterium]|nr:class I SAM-dependent methyltransferase [Fibromonadales bacterium]
MPKYPTRPQDWKEFQIESSSDELLIGNWQVMQEWERPLMRALATNVAGAGKAILEVGFGMGICAEEIWRIGCSHYTVIEAHPVIAEQARNWLSSTNRSGVVIEGFWEEVIECLPHFSFDGIVFDTYPLNESERGCNHFSFIPKAKYFLTQNGSLTYYSDETKKFRTEHLQLLLANYEYVRLNCVSGLAPPETCEYWNNDHMIIPTVSKPMFNDEKG